MCIGENAAKRNLTWRTADFPTYTSDRAHPGPPVERFWPETASEILAAIPSPARRHGPALYRRQ